MAREVIWTEREEIRRPEHNIEEENMEIQSRRKRKKTQTKAEQKQREELKRKIEEKEVEINNETLRITRLFIVEGSKSFCIGI